MAFQAVLAGTAYAEVPAPSCEYMKAAYSELSAAPATVEGDGLKRVCTIFAKHKLFAKDATKAEFATADDLIAHISKRSPSDQAVWIAQEFLRLEQALVANKCSFDKRTLTVRNPSKIDSPRCKAPAELPAKLPR